MTSIARSCTPVHAREHNLLTVPPTPRHQGDYEPYAPRKSSRLSQRPQRRAQTPPPARRDNTSRLQSATDSPPPTTKKPSTTNITTTMPNSPPPTIPKKRTITRKTMDQDMSSNTSSRGSIFAPTLRTEGLLPTPDKTPKKSASKVASGITSIARTLFPVRPETVEEVMPSPRKSRKQYSSYNLGSYDEEETEEPIHVFTDSRERLPELDLSEDNPFNAAPVAPAEPVRRTSQRRQITVPGEGAVSIDDLAEERNDGLVYVFRGKRFFRKFKEDESDVAEESGSDTDDDVEQELGIASRLRGTLPRNNLKPRLLFPTPKQTNDTRPSKVASAKALSAHEEEEADTDIEEVPDVNELTTDIDTDVEGAVYVKQADTPDDALSAAQQTPKAPHFVPASPPFTGRTTRSKSIRKGRITTSNPWIRGAKSASIAASPSKSSSHKKRARANSVESSAKRLRSDN